MVTSEGILPTYYPLEKNPPEVGLPLVYGRLGSGPRLVGWIVSGVRVSASFQIFALIMLLHSAGGGYLRGIFSRG